jgi:hypothetical protein
MFQIINRYDGRFTFAALAACFIPIWLVVLMVLSPGGAYEDENDATYILLFIVICFGIMSTFLLWRFLVRNKETSLVLPSYKQPSLHMKKIFLWIFEFTSVAYSILNMSIVIDCLATSYSDLNTAGNYILGLLHSLGEVVFFLGQIGFISYFANFTLVATTSTNYRILGILIVHVVEWIHKVLLNVYRYAGTSTDMINITSYNCFAESDFYVLKRRTRPFGVPLRTVFSLLAVEMLLNMWHPADFQHQMNYVTDQCSRRNSRQSDEISPLLQDTDGSADNAFQSREAIDSSEDHINIDNEATNMDQQRNTRFIICILIGVFLSLPVVTTFLVVIATVSFSSSHVNAMEVMLCLFNLEILLIVLYTLFSIRKSMKYSTKAIASQGNCLILLFSASFAVLFCACRLMAGLMVDSECPFKDNDFYLKSPAIILVVGMVLEILAIYLQTILVRVSAYITKKKQTFSVVCAFRVLCLLNVISWFMYGIFFGGFSRTMIIEFCFYKKYNWILIRNIALPISGFYRFHLFVRFYECSLKFIS